AGADVPVLSRRRRTRSAGAGEIIGRVCLGIFVEAAAAVLAALRALPARRAVARAEMGHLVETRGRRKTHAAEAALGFGHLHVGLGQLVEEARRDVRRP